jgi:MFS transporter, putative metabolite:H+ symporter
MFFDGFDIYLAGTVLGVTLKTGFSTLPQNATFISATFVGMMLGSFGTGFLGDRYGRRFTYQFNLLIFGLASLAAAFAPSMAVLIACRFVMGVGLGAENVVGYGTMTEFVPARSRGKWSGFTTVCVVMGLPISLLVASLLIPQFGWRSMFVLGGIGALIVWYLRKSLPESPRWLEAVGRTDEAEALMQSIEREAAQGQPLPQDARLRHCQHARPRRHHRDAVPGRDAVRGARRRRRHGADDRTSGGADRDRVRARHRAAASQPGRIEGR